MKRLFTSLALVYLVSACAPVTQDANTGSGLSSITIGTFRTPEGKVAWKKMNLVITNKADATKVQNVDFDLTAFKASNSGKAVNETIKLPKGDYLFVAQYKDLLDKVVYRSCKADAVLAKHVEGKSVAVKIVVCPVDVEVPAGSTEVEDTAVVIEPVLGSEPKVCPVFVTGTKYKVGAVITYKDVFYKTIKDNDGLNPAVNPTLFEKVLDCDGKAIPVPVPAPVPAPKPTTTGDVTKGQTTISGTCVNCHNASGLAKSVVLNSAIIPKLDNTQTKNELKAFHLAIKPSFEGQNRLDLEAALKLIK